MKDVAEIKLIIFKIDSAFDHREVVKVNKEYYPLDSFDNNRKGSIFLNNSLFTGIGEFISQESAKKIHEEFCHSIEKELDMFIVKNIEHLKKEFGVLYERTKYTI